jgi:hypothetical protein
MLALYDVTGIDKMFTWAPHPWFHLVHDTQEVHFQKLLRGRNRRMYLIIGGDTFLDKAFIDYCSPEVYTVAFGRKLIDFVKDLYISVIGDYVLKIAFTTPLTREIDKLYEEIDSYRKVRPGRIVELLAKKWRIRVKLSRSRRQAKRISSKLEDFFAKGQNVRRIPG